MTELEEINKALEGVDLRNIDQTTNERVWLGCSDQDGEHASWFEPSEGGTPYIRADLVSTALESLQRENERLRQLLSEAEKRDKEARAKALEEAAKIADTEEELLGEPSKLVIAAMEAVGPVGNARAAVRTTKASIAKRIRALQSEER